MEKDKQSKVPRQISTPTLMAKWKCSLLDIEYYICNFNLPYYSLVGLWGLDKPEDVFIRSFLRNGHYIFNSKDIEQFEYDHPELLAEEATKPYIKEDEAVEEKTILEQPTNQKDEYRKNPALIELLKKVKPGVDYIFDAVKEIGFSSKDNPNLENDLKNAVIEAFNAEKNKLQEYMKQDYFEDQKLYFPDPGHVPRDFKGTLLRKIVRNQLNRKIGGQDLYELYLKIA